MTSRRRARSVGWTLGEVIDLAIAATCWLVKLLMAPAFVVVMVLIIAGVL